MFRVLASLAAVFLAALIILIALALRLDLPTTISGMVAKTVCSGVMIAARDPAHVIADDLMLPRALVDLTQLHIVRDPGFVTASLPGSTQRLAVHDPARGCVLLAPGARPTRESVRPSPATPLPSLRAETWPQGDTALAREFWPAGLDADALEALVASAFEGSGGTAGANTRGLAIVYQGQMLADRYASGFDARTPQHGWSMAEGVLGLLVWHRLHELGVAATTPVVALPNARPPGWLSDWRTDARRAITVDHLMRMRDGLAFDEAYEPWSEVPRMLWAEGDIAAWAAEHALAREPGSSFRYASAATNLLAGVLRSQFVDDASYWAYPGKALFGPIGAQSARFETDASGTLIGSSYLWASVPDWARLGWLMAMDGKWQGRQLMPAGWLAYARGAAGDGAKYGAHVWRSPSAVPTPECAPGRSLPEDAIFLRGHWGQSMSIIASAQLVVVRTGWRAASDQWNPCEFLADVLEVLHES